MQLRDFVITNTNIYNFGHDISKYASSKYLDFIHLDYKRKIVINKVSFSLNKNLLSFVYINDIMATNILFIDQVGDHDS